VRFLYYGSFLNAILFLTDPATGNPVRDFSCLRCAATFMAARFLGQPIVAHLSTAAFVLSGISASLLLEQDRL
jgi:hypothetical protein